jgi:hypothetical protein
MHTDRLESLFCQTEGLRRGFVRIVDDRPGQGAVPETLTIISALGEAFADIRWDGEAWHEQERQAQQACRFDDCIRLRASREHGVVQCTMWLDVPDLRAGLSTQAHQGRTLP